MGWAVLPRRNQPLQRRQKKPFAARFGLDKSRPALRCPGGPRRQKQPLLKTGGAGPTSQGSGFSGPTGFSASQQRGRDGGARKAENRLVRHRPPNKPPGPGAKRMAAGEWWHRSRMPVGARSTVAIKRAPGAEDG